MNKMSKMIKVVTISSIVCIMLCACEKEDNKTYEEGLREGFEVGYLQSVKDYETVLAEHGEMDVYADNFGYLMGYYDAGTGDNHTGIEYYSSERLHDKYSEGYEKGFQRYEDDHN